MRFDSVEALEAEKFEGFKQIGDLFKDHSSIPEERGNYLVLYLQGGQPEFIKPGVGGFFKNRDPNVETDKLKCNWISGEIVIYIAQAGGIQRGKWSNATLRERISTYMEFGKTKPVGHWGGRYIWQIKNYGDLVICWKPLPNKIRDPKQTEYKMIQEFKKLHENRMCNEGRPFANLKDN